jgi:hypothetical protein
MSREKVFKDKIKQWNIQRNLSRKDVVAAIYLSRQAELSKKTCRIYIRGQHVHWRRIDTYLRKNKIGAESLLAESLPCDAIPSYITFDLVDSAATTTLLPTLPTQTELGPVTSPSQATPDSSSNGSHATTTSLISKLTPESSPNGNSVATTSRRYDRANSSQSVASGEAALVVPPTETSHNDLPLQMEHDQIGFWPEGELSGPIPELSRSIFEQFVGNSNDTTDPLVESTQLFDLYTMMSVTPSSASRSPRQSITPLGHTDSSLHPQHHMSNEATEIQQHNPDYVDNGSTDCAQVESYAFQPVDWPAHFLSWSIVACLRTNEGRVHDAELAMKEASKGFERMVVTRHDRCLTNLNLILALFEAHGKRDIAIELLGKLSIAMRSLKDMPEKESVKMTIRFKMDVMLGVKIERMSDPAVLRHIHYSFERSWGRYSPSTLACLCNLGWRLAGEKDAGRITEALDVLSRARESLERALGHDDPQTIICLAMLARVLFNLERFPEGLEMMGIAMDRINTRFTDCHPYRLSALRRFSLFMQNVHRVDAEPILREVASKRLRVLGPDCELTQGSMKELRDFLIKQERHEDAEDASRAVAESASHIYCQQTIYQLF